jgi:hypothetical protein
MIYGRHPQLGMIPAWQFDMTATNPKINPYVVYPEGMTQETIQPVGPNYGLANPFESWGWEHRKLLVGGTVVVLGAALLAGLVAVLR